MPRNWLAVPALAIYFTAAAERFGRDLRPVFGLAAATHNRLGGGRQF